MVCDENAIHYYNYRYFKAIQLDPQEIDIFGGGSGGKFTKV